MQLFFADFFVLFCCYYSGWRVCECVCVTPGPGSDHYAHGRGPPAGLNISSQGH